MEDPGLGVVGRKGQPSELTVANVRNPGAVSKGWAPRGGVREPSFLTKSHWTGSGKYCTLLKERLRQQGDL